ncbi:MAG TPA: molybdopterin-dependent oxidoreductase [Anaeromyxobacteraceae bacterium]|nr:molybdopterin-dependent oxidoreductase [Anaeromyxobacteraceae bacterium]
MNPTPAPEAWRPTACILCSRNCGIEVLLSGGHLARIRGDQRHPLSAGYLCQKAARLDHYQHHADRLSVPLRRSSDGTYEAISWETAIREVAVRLLAIRRAHGGRAFAYYGGGGQGNHLGGVYGRGLVEAMRTRYHYSALAQEKTGDFWVNGRLFGRQTCHVAEAVEDAELVVLIGTNPWQAHGIRNARETLRAIADDPARTLVVIDPRRTEAAAMARIHLRPFPGTDAYLLSAMLGVIVREGLEARTFLEERTRGFEAVRAALLDVPIDAFAARSGVAVEDVARVARLIASARSAAVRVDLGLQQSLHSTLNSYLEKLLFLLPGHFAKPGCNALHTFLLPLIGHSEPPGPGSSSWTTAITGAPEIAKLFPPNVLPAEIDSEDPARVRGLVVDSANPALSAADTRAYRQALSRLELLVVIDVANTETARLAHYVLPASSQFEKWETTFFNMDFPTQAAHLRAPVLAPLPGTLSEPEIYRRLLVAMGELPRRGFPLLRAIARADRRWPRARLFPLALSVTLRARPALRRFLPFILHDTIGSTFPDGGAAAAPLWAAAHLYARKHGDAVRRSGLTGEGADLGEALFARILGGRSGALLGKERPEDVWSRIRHADGRIHLDIPEMLKALGELAAERAAPGDGRFPLVLIAGERRSYNANQIFRSPQWRKSDGEGALHVHPDDARRLGLEDGGLAVCESERGQIEVRVAISDTLLPGMVTLPHGYGQEYPDGDGRRRPFGPAVNELTSAAHRDPLAGTPYHKHVRVRLRPSPAGGGGALRASPPPRTP